MDVDPCIPSYESDGYESDGYESEDTTPGDLVIRTLDLTESCIRLTSNAFTLLKKAIRDVGLHASSYDDLLNKIETALDRAKTITGRLDQHLNINSQGRAIDQPGMSQCPICDSPTSNNGLCIMHQHYIDDYVQDFCVDDYCDAKLSSHPAK